MATATTVQIGAWNYVNETFIAHPSSPTGAIFDINDGSTFTLMDSGGGRGDGLDLVKLNPTVFLSNNPRVIGESVKRRIYNKNREIKARLVWGVGTNYSTWNTAIHNLIQLTEGISPDLPGVLKIQATLSSTPIYLDIIECHVFVPYDELLWAQMITLNVEVTFMCKPYARTPRQVLQNLVMNPGFEAPSGPGVTMFTDPFTNTNAYVNAANGYFQESINNRPIRYYRLGEPLGFTTNGDSVSGNSATIAGTVTLGGSPGAISGDSTTYALFDGATGYSQANATSLPTGAASFSMACWFYIISNPGTTRTLFSYGLNSTAHGSPQFTLDSSGRVQFSDTTTATAVSAAQSPNTWHQLVGTYDGTTLRIYIDGVAGNTAAATVATPGASTFVTMGATSLAVPTLFFPGRLQECTIWGSVLTASEIANLYQIGKGTFTPTALTTDTLRFNDVVQADMPTRYYRLNEASGTTASDAMVSGSNGTYVASPTLGVSGALTGDSDTAITVNGTTQWVTVPTTGLPTGSPTAFSMECWIKVAGAPAGSSVFFAYGDSSTGNKVFQLFMDNARKIYFSNATISTVASAAVSTGAWHHVVGTWDGANLRCYVDNVTTGPSAATMAIPVTNWCTIGASAKASPDLPLACSLDECIIYQSTALSAARVTVHYNTGTNALSANSTSMQIAAGNHVTFGAPWVTMNTWQCRFRYTTGMQAVWYPSFTDQNNNIGVQVNGSNLFIFQISLGSQRTFTTTNITLISEIEYWISITLFPTTVLPSVQQNISGNNPIIATIFVDSAGIPSTQVGTGTTTLINTGLTGQFSYTKPQISTVSGVLDISATTQLNGNNVSQFGPGGWYYSSTGSGVASGNWDQITTSLGHITTKPVASAGSGMLQAAPAGLFIAQWANADTTSAQTIKNTAIPVQSGNTIALNVPVYTSGASASLNIIVSIQEYDANATLLRTNTAVSGFGSQTYSSPLVQSIYIIGASTNYIVLVLKVSDTTGGAPNTIVEFDSVQLWNVTNTQSTMPYCELRFPQSIAQCMVSGIIGDVAAPAIVALSLFESSIATNGTINYWIGRRSSVSRVNELVTQIVPTSTQQLDSTAWGGYTVTASSQDTGIDIVNMAGTFHRYTRSQVTPTGSINSAGMQVTLNIFGGTSSQTNITLPTTYPFTASSVWTIADGGTVSMPAGSVGTQVPSTTANYYFYANAVLTNTSASTLNVAAYLPTDTETMIGTITCANASNLVISVFHDGINQSATISAVQAAFALPFTSFVPPYALAVTPTGTTLGSLGASFVSTGNIVDPMIDPKLKTSTANGVNQWLVMAQDSAGNLLPCYLEVSYNPCYLLPL